MFKLINKILGRPEDCKKIRYLITKEKEPSKDHFWDFMCQPEDERDESRKLSDLCSKIEEEYDEKDTEMLIRLIKIRKSLWT